MESLRFFNCYLQFFEQLLVFLEEDSEFERFLVLFIIPSRIIMCMILYNIPFFDKKYRFYIDKNFHIL